MKSIASGTIRPTPPFTNLSLELLSAEAPKSVSLANADGQFRKVSGIQEVREIARRSSDALIEALRSSSSTI